MIVILSWQGAEKNLFLDACFKSSISKYLQVQKFIKNSEDSREKITESSSFLDDSVFRH